MCQNTTKPADKSIVASLPLPRGDGDSPSPSCPLSTSLSCITDASDIDDYMVKAFGAKLCYTAVPDVPENDWIERWSTIARLKGRLYHVPGGSVGRHYVDLLSTEVAHLSAGNFPSERLMVFSAVILQCHRMIKKGSDIRRVMEKHMEKWSNDDFDTLVEEAVGCDKTLRSQAHMNNKEHFVNVFTRLMLQGKTKAAMRWLSDQSEGLVLPPSHMTQVKAQDGTLTSMSVLEALRLKHPEPQSPSLSTLLKCDTLPPRLDVEATGAQIHYAASRIQGSAGPSGTDAHHWQDVLLRFGAHSDCLRDSVAALVRRLSNTITPWDDIRALVACRLIALDKKPGIRPIGIGETLRRILGKVVCSMTRFDLSDSCNISQLCGGVRCGIEAAVHTVSDLFKEHEEDGWGVLMIDASNAFNRINRQAALWNSRVLWPSCSLFLFNTYRGWAPLIVKDSKEFLYSKEGVTQGDPLSMFVYAVATIPLIDSVGRPADGRDVWYADDASACSSLNGLKNWFSTLLQVCPSFGYYPEARKCVLVVNQDHFSEACEMFSSLGVKVETSHRLLGGVVGDHTGTVKYIEECVDEWTKVIQNLILVAETQPQVSYYAYTKSAQCQWSYLQRVIPDCGSFFEPIEKIVSEQLIPTLFGCDISLCERALFSLPTRMGGLNITNAIDSAPLNYATSRKLAKPIIEALKAGGNFDLDMFMVHCETVRKESIDARDSDLQDMFADVIVQLDTMQQRAVNRVKNEKMSSWLNVVPTAKHQFDLSEQEFRDALAIRYRKPLLGIPPYCDGCSAPFDLTHALSCRKGGLVTQRHNEVRDAFGDLASLAWN